MTKIRIRELRVKGIKKDYVVNFPNKLNIIAGAIYTGKTSILDLIDYCFGANDSPSYSEITKNGRDVLLEISIDGEVFTIERQLFSTRQVSTIHHCAIEKIKEEHKSEEVSTQQRVGQISISSFLLSKLNLAGIQLKEAPTQDSSGTDTLSFRDVMWFSYLKKARIAGENLLFEKEFIKKIKLSQVFDVIFDIHSQKLAQLSSQIRSTESEIFFLKTKVNNIQEFAHNEGIPLEVVLIKKNEEFNTEIQKCKSKLQEIDEKINSNSDIAGNLREEVLKEDGNLQKLKTNLRNDTTTLYKLIPLRGQYSEDIKKLNFLVQAKEVINPLGILFCPVCLKRIEIQNTEEKCPLCHNDVEVEKDVEIDLSKEIRTLSRKLNELSSYIEEVESRIKSNSSIMQSKEKILSDKKNKLNETMRRFIAPYLTEREENVATVGKMEAEINHIAELIRIRGGIKTLLTEIAKKEADLDSYKRQLEDERVKTTDFTGLIKSLSEIYTKNLKTINFPKLSESYIDDKLFPYVRGQVYSKLSSEGAINLAGICWISSIYEEAITKDKSHPGFLLLDGVQRGISMGTASDPDFRDQSIVTGIYTLLKRISELKEDCQIIVVDNFPPASENENVVVRYSGKANEPPYGFIDDETS